MKTRVQLYTVPGQVFYNATRRMVLKGADCVVFVADSQEAMIEANADAMKNLRENLVANELDPDNIPLVIQYNKRDLPNAASLDELNQALNSRGVPFIEASAKNGTGVEETLKVATQLVFRVLANKYGNEGTSSLTSGGVPRPAPKPASAPPPPPAPPPAAAPRPGLPPPTRVPSPSFASTDDLLDSLGGPAPAPVEAPPLSLDDALELPSPSTEPGVPLDAVDPLAALSSLETDAPADDGPGAPEFSLDSLESGPDPDPTPSDTPGELDLDLGLPPASPLPTDPLESPLDAALAGEPEADQASPASPPAPLDDPFSGLPFENAIPLPAGASSGSPLDAMLDLGAPGGSSTFTSDPVAVEASVELPRGTLTAEPVLLNVPVELTLSHAGQDILIPIRLQLKIRIS